MICGAVLPGPSLAERAVVVDAREAEILERKLRELLGRRLGTHGARAHPLEQRQDAFRAHGRFV